MKAAAIACLLLGVVGAGFAPGEKARCPRHIEGPSYPAMAHAAHAEGTAHADDRLRIHIEALGKVGGAGTL
jgi:hypothetical protein